MALKALFQISDNLRWSRNVQLLPAGAQENKAENDDKHQVEDERVQRHFQLGVDLGEEARERKTTVAGKSVAHATTSRHDGSCRKQHADEREARRWLV